LIQNISVERIQVELTKILISDHPEYLTLLHEYGILAYIIPEYDRLVDISQENPYHLFTVDHHTIEAMKHIEASKVLRWTMLCHDLGKADTKSIDENGVAHFYHHVEKSVELARGVFNRLKFDNDTKNKCLILIAYHDYRIEADIKLVRRLLNRIGEDVFLDYIKVRKADIHAQNPVYLEKQLENLDEIVALYEQVLELNQCVQIKDLAISGKDLIELGVQQGQEIGRILNALLEEVIEQPKLNDKTLLVQRVASLIGDQ
jgi:tRNA nucleotidyltransferase (CCA-adding enzyme)